jgi:hypothetical protein
MEVDNLRLILPLLKFESKDDFYYLQILQRKKENPELGSNSRVIKNYYITSQEHLLKRYDEIKKLCQVFNARASIRLNKRSFEKVAFKTMVNTANSMSNREYEFIKSSYDRACGLGHNDKDKTWVLDIDNPFYQNISLSEVKEYINNAEPFGDKTYILLPSKSGCHMIVKPFNLQGFSEKYPKIEVHKDNSTNLFIP